MFAQKLAQHRREAEDGVGRETLAGAQTANRIKRAVQVVAPVDEVEGAPGIRTIRHVAASSSVSGGPPDRRPAAPRSDRGRPGASGPSGGTSGRELPAGAALGGRTRQPR